MVAKVFIILSVFFVVTISKEVPTSECGKIDGIPDEDKFQVGNKTMVFVPYEKSWTDALKVCTELGMQLVAIQTAEQQRAIEQFLHKRIWGSRKTVLDNVYWYLWTSGADVDSDGNFEWKTINKPVTFTSWGVGEPNGGTGESCIELRYVSSGSDRDLKWNDSLCWIKKRFICENV